MTLAIPLSPETEARLAAKARRAGMDMPAYAARLVERDVSHPTLEEILDSPGRNAGDRAAECVVWQFDPRPSGLGNYGV